MEAPIQVRFEKRVKSRLKKTKDNAGLDQVDVIRLAVDELFKKYPDDNKLIEAMIRRRSSQASEARATA